MGLGKVTQVCSQLAVPQVQGQEDALVHLRKEVSQREKERGNLIQELSCSSSFHLLEKHHLC